MKNLYLLIIMFYLPLFTLYGQRPSGDKCGVSIHDQQLMESLYPNDGVIPFSGERNSVVYVPVKFHLTANDDGTGRIEMSHVLNQLCVLNQDYESSGMVFYIYDGFNFINQTRIYSSPGANANAVQAKKTGNALNVFITENAAVQADVTGTVLGFYQPQGDYIIIRKKELVDKTNTLSHETGHYFSLRHTFYGWESVPYDKTKHGETVTITTVPGDVQPIPVELMNGSNCTVAADMICDTPPDYNFGITAGNCVFNTVVYDRNGDRIRPMKNNQMGYFLDCDTFKFTEMQTQRMLTNFNSSGRSIIRNNYVPNTTEIEGQPVLVAPVPGAKVDAFNQVTLDWEQVAGASQYLVEVKGQGQYFWQITSGTEYTISTLKKNNAYVWTVKPFNEGNTCSLSKTSNFKTGDGTVSATSDVAIVENIRIMPSIVTRGEDISIGIEVSSETRGKLFLYNMLGDMIVRNTVLLNTGYNNVLLDSKGLPAGMYLLCSEISGKRNIQKFIIQ